MFRTIDLRCQDKYHLGLVQGVAAIHSLWTSADEPFCRECDPFSHFQKHDYRCSKADMNRGRA